MLCSVSLRASDPWTDIRDRAVEDLLDVPLRRPLDRVVASDQHREFPCGDGLTRNPKRLCNFRCSPRRVDRNFPTIAPHKYPRCVPWLAHSLSLGVVTVRRIEPKVPSRLHG